MKYIFASITFIFLLFGQASSVEPLFGNNPENLKIVLNNRILARINGKVLTAYDIMKRMDIMFYKQFPQYLTSPEARHKFYEVNWKSILHDLINKELIMIDAQEKQMDVSGGDVRQEMEMMFGPNMIENLDKIGMGYDEASKIVEGELLIKRMINARINAKALRIVTPAKVKQSYDEFIQDPRHAKLTQWRYQVVTIKDRTPQKGEETANKAYKLLIEERVPFDKLVDTMKEKNLLGRKAKVTVSEEINNNEQELSESYKLILSNMNTGMISQPSAQKSRANQTIVYRIFYVKEKIPGGMPPFKEIENRLKDKLLNEVADQETENYLKKLRHHYHIREKDLEEMIPANYQPFVLQ